MNLLLKNLFLYFLLSTSCLLANPEKWTRSEDKVTILATLVSFDSETNKVTLKLQNGSEAVVDAAILVKENQQRLAKHAEELAAPPKKAEPGHLESFEVKNGGGHKIHIYRPSGYIEEDVANKSRPVAFVYSPGGVSTQILNRMTTGADELGWLIVGVDAYSNKRLEANEHSQVIADSEAAYKYALEQVTFDKNKVVFGGFSGGAYWSYKSSSFLNDRTAGIIAIGGWMSNRHDVKYSKGMSVALVNGLDDKGANEYIEVDTKCLEKKNRATVKLITYPGGHTLAKPETITEAMRWIHETKEFGK